MRLTPTRSAAIAPLVALTLLLVACSGGSSDPADDTTATTADDKGKDDSGKGTEPTADATEDTTEDTTKGGGAQGSSEGAGCLEGSWVADVTQQLDAVEAAMADSGVEATIDISGDVVTTFSNGETTSAYNNQVMDIGMAVEGQEIRSVTTMNGTIVGTYTATDTMVTMTVTDASGLEIAMSTSMGGTVIDNGLAGYDESMRKAMETTSTVAYTCSGDTLTISMPNASLGTSVESVMHRR